jgi:acid stress chaperone HdeA
MNHLALLAIGISLTSSAAVADAPAAAAKPEAAAAAPTTAPAAPATAPATAPAKALKPGQIKCEDFLMYDDVTRPQIVGWSEGAVHKGKPGDEVFDVERTNTLVPILVEDCTREPKASYWQKFKAEWHSEFGKKPASVQAK